MDSPNSSLSNEIEAMTVIGRALADLTDPAARQRVLHWAHERFATDAVPQTPAVIAAEPANADLAVDNLTDIFPDEAPAALDDSLLLEEPAPVVEKPKQPIESVLRSFAADFRAFAEEWNGAAA